MTFIVDAFKEIMAPKTMVRSKSKKACFRGRGPLDRKQKRWVETLEQSE